MPTYQSFSYIEQIQSRFQNSLTKELVINNNTSEEALLLRLLLGTLSFEHKLSGELVKQNRDFSTLGLKINRISSTKPIRQYLEPNLTLSHLNAYLKRNKYVNKRFYVELLLEFSWYFFRSSKRNHSAAFIHLYRVIEYISYTFPLIYTSKSRDYYGTFNNLKNYFDRSKSELMFFQNFLDKLFDGDLRLESPVTFNMTSIDGDIAKSHYKIIKNILSPNKVESDNPDTSIETKYEHLLDFTIQIRNRFFHFSVGGRRNLSCNDLKEPDIFFEIVNKEIINWVSVIYLEVLRYLVEQERVISSS